jgi:hypothetical protein
MADMLVPGRFKEFDMVTYKGTIATVVLVYDSNPPAYELELFDENLETIGLVTAVDSELEPRG